MKKKENIKLEYANVDNNAGRKAVAKLMLNSFWGKYGMGDSFTSTVFINDAKKYYDFLISQSKELHDIYVITDNCVMVTMSPKDEYNEGNPVSNLAIAAFTTSHARLRLLTMMRKLGQRILYYDTDSVLYVSRPGDEEPQTGDMLGEWDSQLEKGESHITEFVSLGPKVYSYTTNTGRIEMKCKGLSQNGYTEDILEWDENEKKC